MSETVTRTLPAPFIEAAGIALTDKLTPMLGTPLDTASFAPQVAEQDPLQLQAVQKASGLGSFEPFLTQAGADARLNSSQDHKPFKSSCLHINKR